MERAEGSLSSSSIPASWFPQSATRGKCQLVEQDLSVHAICVPSSRGSIGCLLCQSNQRVLFTPAMDILNHLLASQVDHSLVRKLKTYTEPTLLICD